MLAPPVDIGMWQFLSSLDGITLAVLACLALAAFALLAMLLGKLSVIFAMLAGLGMVMVLPGGILLIGGGLMLGLAWILTRNGVGGSVSIYTYGDDNEYHNIGIGGRGR